MRRVLLLAALLCSLFAAGCATPLTAGRVEASFARAFSGLYTLQQAQDGRAVPGLQVRAGCRRTGPDATGPGEDWACVVQYVDAGTALSQAFELLVKPDGCWRAEAPPVSQPALRAHPVTGAPRPNPLAEFDGCFDTSWR